MGYTYTYTAQGIGYCDSCPADTYKGTIGPGACTPCNAHASTILYAVRTSISDCRCNPGYGGSVGYCELCPVGTYKPSTANVACNSCSPLTNLLVGSTTYDDCVCDVGWTGVYCYKCRHNTYKDFPGPGACIDCPANSASVQGAPNIETCKCNMGYSWNATTRLCVACVSGKYKDVVGPSECIFCSTNLPVSQISPEASTSKSMCKCNAGYGDSACTICASGEYKDIVGASPCISCGDATSSPIGSTNKSDCICGFGASPEVIQGETVCSLCDVGHYKDAEGRGECHACGIPVGERGAGGEYSGEKGASTCTLCQPGEYANTTMATACTLCQAGTYAGTILSTACVDCQAGAYAAEEGLSACVNCTPGTFSPTTAGRTCELCPRGTYAGTILSTACVDCQAGAYAAEEGLSACVNCTPGTFSPTTAGTSCEQCPKGTYLNTSGGTVCLNCSAGYEDNIARTRCPACPLGRFSAADRASTCDPCPEGTYLNASARTACFPCAYGNMTSPEASVAPADCVCRPGHIASAGGGCESDFYYPPTSGSAPASGGYTLSAIALTLWVLHSGWVHCRMLLSGTQW